MNQVGSVKSAQRVFLILQDFSEKRRAQRAAEVAKSLRVPISSCVALLSTMVEQGILLYDETNRSYIPSTKVRDLTNWVVSENLLERRVIYFAKRLYRELGTPAAVSRRAGLYVEWLYTLGGPMTTRPGERRPLCKTINGRAVLSHMPDSAIREVVEAHNESFGRESFIDPDSIAERVHAARDAGYASGVAPLAPGLAAICFAIEDGNSGEEYLLTMQLPASELRLRESKIVDVARRMIPDLALQAGYA